MVSKALVAGVLVLGLVSGALAAGSGSSSRPPAPSKAQPTDYDLGVTAVKAGNYARALPLLQNAVQADARNADAWNYIGFSHRKLKQFDQSLAAYQKALAINPDHRGANEYLGELFVQTGDLRKARERLEKLNALCPSGCREYEDLKKTIETYQLGQKKN